MNLSLFHQKLSALGSYSDVDVTAVRKLAEVLPLLGDWELHRINPVQFAEENQVAVSAAIDLFVYAARVGIFDLNWNLVCPTCGILIDSHATLNSLQEGESHCTLCHVDVPSNLDDQVEVTFAIDPSLKQLSLNPFQDFSGYWRFYMSQNFRRSARLTDYVEEMRRGEALIGAGHRQDIDFEAESSRLYRLMSAENHTVCFITASAGNEADEPVVTLRLEEGGFSPDRLKVQPGRVRLRVQNLLGRHAGVVLVMTDFERLGRILRESPSRMLPFFTGKMLLNTQSFRNLFRVQNLIPDLKLRLRSLTVLFTDLKGSTALYSNTGDAFAYSLVQEHYRLLSDAVRLESGAVVKTMGDAIMASFSDSASATRAAIQMMESIQSFNRSLGDKGYSLGLKVGMHEGPALVVNSDERLDYFGQTVNIAARVQALANEAEIWLTEPVQAANGVRESLCNASYIGERRAVSLKGVGEPTTVYRWKRT
jgi:class 3 adenylate cyclase